MARSEIARGGRAAIILAQIAQSLAITFHNLRRLVRRTVVDNDQLKVSEMLIKNTLDRLAQQRGPIIGRDDHRNGRIYEHRMKDYIASRLPARPRCENLPAR